MTKRMKDPDTKMPAASGRAPQTTWEAEPVLSVGPTIKFPTREAAEAFTESSGFRKVDLGRRLAAAREGMKLTQGELAKRLNKSRVTVNQYESGVIEPPIKMIDQLAEVLAVDPGLLAFGASRPSTPEGERLTVIRAGADSSEYVELSINLGARLGINADRSSILEMPSDAPTFQLRRGDLVFLDTTVTTLRGDGHLYAVRGSGGSLSVVRPEIQLLNESQSLKVTFGQGQISEVEPAKVEVVGAIQATLRSE